jgi:plastocyanin
MMMRKHALRGVGTFLCGVALVACGSSSTAGTSSSSSSSSGPPAAATVNVVASGSTGKFDLAAVSVKAGETVEWDFKDSTNGPHTVTTDDTDHPGQAEKLDSQGQSITGNSGDVYKHTFAKAGTYYYLCTIHPDMKGKVAVS